MNFSLCANMAGFAQWSHIVNYVAVLLIFWFYLLPNILCTCQLAILYHIHMVYKFLRYVNSRMPQVQHFRDYIFEDHQPFKNPWISCANVLHMHMASSLFNYLLLSTPRCKKSTFGYTPSGLMYRNYPRIHYWGHTEWIENSRVQH